MAVGSRAAETGGASMAAYAVSKQALHALVRVLALENRGSVRVNAVLPGTIDTPANRGAMKARGPEGLDLARGDRARRAVPAVERLRADDGRARSGRRPGLTRRATGRRGR